MLEVGQAHKMSRKRGGQHQSTLKQLGYSNVNVCVIFSADKSRHKSAVKRAEAARLMARW